MKVLHLLPRLDQSSSQIAMQQLHGLTGAGLAGGKALVLGPPCHEPENCIPLDFLNRRGWFDFDFVWKLRQYLQCVRPDVIHAWGLEPLRCLALADWGILGRVVLSQPLHGRKPGWLQQRLLSLVGRIIAHEPPEYDRLSRLGLKQVSLVPPGVATVQCSFMLEVSPRIACLGTADIDFGFRDAIWAFDILRYVAPKAELVIVGAKEELSRAAHFAQVIGSPQGISYQAIDEAISVLPSARIVWVVGRGDASWPCLQAQANGRALITMADSSVVRPGETGVVVPAGDKVALTKRTWALWENQQQRERIAQGGYQSARERYPIAATVESFRRIYGEIAGIEALAA